MNSLVRAPDGALYAASYGLGVYKSTDAGDSWQQTSSPGTVGWCLAVDSSGTLFEGTVGGGVFKSTDGGAAWFQPATEWQPTTMDVRSILPVRSGRLIIGTANNGIFYLNKGDTAWTQSSGSFSSAGVMSLCLGGDGEVYAGTTRGIFVSGDTGATWSLDTSLSLLYVNQLAVDDSGNVWAATMGGLLVKHHDSTAAWDTVNSLASFSVSVTGSGLILVGLMGGNILSSTNGGSSWSLAGTHNGLPGEDVKSIIVDPANEAYAATWGGGVFSSTDNGSSWHQANLSCTKINTFLVDSAGTLLVGTDAAGIFRSTDGGSSWSGNDLINSTVISMGQFPDGKLILSANNGLYRSSDDGITWNHLNADYWANTAYVEQWAFDKNGWAFGVTPLGIYLSTDEGDTWSGPISPNTSRAGGVITIDSTGAIYAAWDTLFVSSDDGGTWKPLWSGKAWIYCILSFGNGDVFVGAGTGIFRSTDFGTSWLQVGPSWSATSLTVNSSGQIFATVAGAGVYVSRDSGVTWSPVNSGLPTNNIQSVAITRKNQAYAATQGAGVFAAENATSIRPTEQSFPSMFVLHQNYPNPFNPSTFITYQLPASGFVELKVFDVLGREVETLVNERQSAGAHSVKFNGTNLASGIYFYRLQAGTYYDTKKLLLLK
ncbi:MAG: T9SS type A sorting domain-containing protein [Bacteroidetes bacterium]|nr:T9SS type A sorting domain-containing protein [Bacteroidota bacterium]